MKTMVLLDKEEGQKGKVGSKTIGELQLQETKWERWSWVQTAQPWCGQEEEWCRCSCERGEQDV